VNKHLSLSKPGFHN